MATLPAPTHPSPSSARTPLRLRLDDVHQGSWWPQSRDLQVEVRDLLDHFPAYAGRVDRLLFSRPDWDDPLLDDGGGVRKVRAARGMVKVGSFPRDDTHAMVLTMSTGVRLRLAVVPSTADAAEAKRLGWVDDAPVA